jgi:ribosomal protein L16/L10AE
MGKGKGTFEFWATRYVSLFCRPGVFSLKFYNFSVPTGRVIFEIGGAPIREELAREGTSRCIHVDV